MDGRLDVWIDGWTDRPMDGWTGGQMDGWKDGRRAAWPGSWRVGVREREREIYSLPYCDNIFLFRCVYDEYNII